MGYKWYVYELYDDDGVFYVGKGCGKRHKTTKRDGSTSKQTRAALGKSRIVAYFVEESDAFAHEKERMAWYEGLTNKVNYHTSLKAIQRAAEIEWSKVYKNVHYEKAFRQQMYDIAETCYEKISKEIQCLGAANAEVLADLLALATKKLLRANKPLQRPESHRSIICSQ